MVDLGCAAGGVLAAAVLRFGNDVTQAYLALSLALPLLWVTALWLAGAYDTRFIGTGSDEFRKVLNAGVGLTAAIAIFSYAVNLQLSAATWSSPCPVSRCLIFSPGTRYASNYTGNAELASACIA